MLYEVITSADFFNVAEFPQMSYKSSAVKFNGDAPAEVEGQLTLLGVSKPVTLKIERWVCKNHPMRKKPMCGGDASATIKRVITSYSIHYTKLYEKFSGVPRMSASAASTSSACASAQRLTTMRTASSASASRSAACAPRSTASAMRAVFTPCVW